MKAVLVLALLVPMVASATTTYLCVADKATGMEFDKATKTWDITRFKASGKHVVSQATEAELALSPAKWLVKEVGDKMPSYTCSEGFSKLGQIYCQGFGEFKFNRENGRYLRTYTFGYYNDIPGKPNELFGAEGENTPLVEIGKCSPIN